MSVRNEATAEAHELRDRDGPASFAFAYYVQAFGVDELEAMGVTL